MVMPMFGMETEFGFTAVDHQGNRVASSTALRWFMGCARKRLPHLPGDERLFLQNGSVLYIDYGCHPELATPECTSPDEVVSYLRAGECLLLEIADQLVADMNLSEVRLLKCNVDYLREHVTWGCHESYLYRHECSDLAQQLLPHLVSRIIYTGSGGFNNKSPGLEFSLSPRVYHLEQDISRDSTKHRGIFHTKNEPLCGNGFNRLHIICGDSACSELANWLKTGTTALIVAMIDAGLWPGIGLALQSPVAAMRTFAADPGCTAAVELAGDGQEITAIALQQRYLAQVEAHLGAACMPPWAAEVCRRWRTILAKLQAGPESVAMELDWANKLIIFKDRLRHWRHVAWDDLQVWNHVVTSLSSCIDRRLKDRLPIDFKWVKQHLDKCSDLGIVLHKLTGILHHSGLSWERLDAFNALRLELFELDVRYGQLGRGGIFTALDGARVLHHQVVKPAQIQSALDHPPAFGRAHVRGTNIRRLAGAGVPYRCDWDGIWGAGQYLNLSDPLVSSADWVECHEEDLYQGLSRLL